MPRGLVIQLASVYTENPLFATPRERQPALRDAKTVAKTVAKTAVRKAAKSAVEKSCSTKNAIDEPIESHDQKTHESATP